MSKPKRTSAARSEASRSARNAPSSPVASPINQWPLWLLVLIPTLLHFVVSLLVLQPSPYHGGDNATYVALARSIIERGTYTEIWNPALPPETLYPPVFPLMLAGVMSLGATSWVALKLFSILLSTTAVAVSTLWLRRMTTPTLALAGAILIAINPGILEQTHMVLSEIPFWAFTMAALWAVTHVSAKDEHARDARWIALAALMATIAWLTRSAGLPLVVAIAVWLLWHHRWRLVAIFAAVAVPAMLAWTIRGQLVNARGYGGYLLYVDPYRPELGRITVLQLLPRAFTNAGHYFAGLGPRALLGTAPLAPAIGMLVLAFAIAWWLARFIRGPGIIEIWVLLYLGIVLVWPETWSGERFLIVLIPALIFFVLDGWQQIARRNAKVAIPAGALGGVVVGIIALMSVSQQIASGHDCRRRAHDGERLPCVQETIRDVLLVAEDVRGKLPKHSVVLSRKPSLFFVLSGYQSVIYPYSAVPGDFFKAAKTAHSRYLVVDNTNLAPMYLYPALKSDPARFCSVKGVSQPQATFMRFDTISNGRAQPATSDDVTFHECAAPL